MSQLDMLSVNSIRILSADAIQKANSGHPGLPLGCASIAYELWMNHLNHNPADPYWPNRDRFILSGGHGSMLLYSLLHLFGYGNLSKEDLMQFRQMDSLTPGHPEYGHTIGVEATTGPLGAGMGMAVGMALAETHLAAVFNREDYPVIDHYTYVLGGDGCMMEGISSEAFSLAGTLGLGKLIVLYDSNKISIEGSTDIAFREDVAKRMEAFGFQTLLVEDGNDLAAIGQAIETAKADTEHPSFITIRTQIGYGCPAKQGKASAHGEPLGTDNIAALRENLGWESEEPFYVPEEVYEHFRKAAEEKAETEAAWKVMFAAYCEEYPELETLWKQYYEDGAKKAAAKMLEEDAFWKKGEKADSTRNISGKILNQIKDILPNLIGGSADLAPSNKTNMKDAGDYSSENRQGRNLHFGVRELAMTAIGNGLALHGGIRAFVATFFVFSDYTKPMARLSALMKLPLTFVFTHDSIGVGEDGPTHEPVEQLAMMRALPNFHVFRPCDAAETAAAWYYAVASEKTPTALVLSRQNLPPMAGSGKGALQGAYVLDDCEGTPDLILIASGSEVSLAVQAKAALVKDGQKVRVVSMPSMEVFEEQSEEYKESVLPKAVRRRVAVEALSGFGWDRYTGLDGALVTMDGFGASGPAEKLLEHFGFTVEHVVEVARSL
ncbi:MAG: transketolase [Lachnospiraceae bacterium]|nr:transketolase [Lachnospiraceae bacterium]MCI9282705.1 transketolase [Lachnospiraceae bacterium]